MQNRYVSIAIPDRVPNNLNQSFIWLMLFVAPPEVKPERWIEIASPYINFPTGSSLQVYVFIVISIEFLF